MSKHKFKPVEFTPLIRATNFKTPHWLIVETQRMYAGMTFEGAKKLLELEASKCEYWINGIYQVQIQRNNENRTAWINIRRWDGKAILRDWRHFQAIKNQLVGENCEGVELYPAEDRLSDSANKYHIFCSLDSTYRFPFGMKQRDVNYDVDDKDVSGMKQRPLADDLAESGYGQAR